MRIGGVLIAALLAGWEASAQAQTPAGSAPTARIPASVEIYAQAIRTDSTADVEKLYRLGLRAAEDLTGPGSDVLEELRDADYAATEEKMQGFDVNRAEVVFVCADPAYFSKLSRDRGDRVSREFFETVGQVGEMCWPVYVERQTDYSGCTKFGSLELVRCYRLLTRFRKLYPERYGDRIDELLQPLEYEFTNGVCACGVVEDMEKEFRAFLREFPKASIAPKVQERLNDLETGALKMKDHCLPG